MTSKQLLPQAPRDPRIGLEDLVQRLAEDVLGDDVRPAAGGEIGALGDEARLHGDVHRAVPHAQHDDLLVDERGVVDVGVGVHLDAVEVPREPRLRPARVPVVAVRDEQRVVAPLLAALQPNGPDPVVVALRVLDAGLEADVLAQPEVVDVVVEVRGDVRVVREVRIGLRHGVVGVLHALPRGVDVQRLVGRRHPVAVPEHPVPADAVALLEAVHRDAAVVEALQGGDAGRAGADDAGVREGGHGGRAPDVAERKDDGSVTLARR